MKTLQRFKDTPGELAFQAVMPLDLGIRIPEDDSVRLLKQITEGMDFSKLNQAYFRINRADEATPKQLFEIVALGFMNGKYSLREMEGVCRCDIRFMCLLQGKKTPDHSRLGRFIRERLQGRVMFRVRFLRDLSLFSTEI